MVVPSREVVVGIGQIAQLKVRQVETTGDGQRRKARGLVALSVSLEKGREHAGHIAAMRRDRCRRLVQTERIHRRR